MAALPVCHALCSAGDILIRAPPGFHGDWTGRGKQEALMMPLGTLQQFDEGTPREGSFMAIADAEGALLPFPFSSFHFNVTWELTMLWICLCLAMPGVEDCR